MQKPPIQEDIVNDLKPGFEQSPGLECDSHLD